MSAQITYTTVVLLGTFDPDAFIPEALAKAKIISAKEASLAKFKLLLPGEGMQFEFSWGDLLVAQNRLQVGTSSVPYIRVCDFAIKALQELPAKSVVDQFGINMEAHYKVASMAVRDQIGRKVAPPTAWGEWGKRIAESMDSKEPTIHGGMMHLRMRLPFADDIISGWRDVAIEPSTRIPDGVGVYFKVNHHHQYSSTQDKVDKAMQARSDPLGLLTFLSSRFDESIATSEKIFEEVLKV